MVSSTIFDEVPNIDEYNDWSFSDLDFFNGYKHGDSGYYSTFSDHDIVDPFNFGAADILNTTNDSSSSNLNANHSVDQLHGSNALHRIGAVAPAPLENISFEEMELEAVENSRSQSIHSAAHITSLAPHLQSMDLSAPGAEQFNLSPQSLDKEGFFSLDYGLSVNPTRTPEMQDLFSQKEMAMLSLSNAPNLQGGSELSKPLLDAAVKWMVRQSSKCTRNSRSTPITSRPSGKYRCTVGCGQSFSRIDVWKKHEAEQIPREGWICCVPNSFWVEGRKICTYCGVQDPGSDHHATTKHPIPCEHRPMGRGRTFFRKEHLKNHLQKVHPAIPWHQFLDRGHFEFEPQFPRVCYLCQSYCFSSFNDRFDHLIAHFESNNDPNGEHAVDSEPALDDVQVGMENGLDRLETISSGAGSVIERRHTLTEATVSQQMSTVDPQKPEPKACQMISRVGKDSPEGPPSVSGDSRTKAMVRIRSSHGSSKNFGHIFLAGSAKGKLRKWTFTPFIGGAKLARGLFQNITRLQSPPSMMRFLSNFASLLPRRVPLKGEKSTKPLPSTLNGAPSESQPVSLLLAARIPSAAPNGSYFIPSDALDRYLTKASIKAEMSRFGINSDFSLEEMADCVLKKYPKIFGILTMINKGNQIDKFMLHELSDAHLPLRIPESAEYRRPLQPELAVFESWNDSDIHRFSITQWSFLAPFFAIGTSRPPHYNFEPKTVLPFPKNRDLSAPRSGGFSTVFAVKIHPAHHNFDSSYGNKVQFAVKRLSPRSSNHSDFEREISSLGLFSHRYAHDHIIELLASYSVRGGNYLLFQWADKDLRRYWEDSAQPPKLTSEMMHWSLRQMRGLASGLDMIHNYSSRVVDEGESAIGLPQSRKAFSDRPYGRHGDIKPENILWFSHGTNDDRGVLKIADFGLAAFSTSSSPKEVATPDCGTLTYRPPDYDLGSEISPQYDIWSLGCVFLEFITWMLMGSEGGDLFRDSRMESGTAIDKFNIDNFFTIDGGFSGVPKSARLKDGVRLWIADLRGHPNCSYALRDLLLVIESELLVPEAHKRVTSGALVRQLDQIIEKGIASEQYLLADTVLQLRPPPTSKKRDFKTTHMKTWSPDTKRARLDIIKSHWSLSLPRSPDEDQDHEQHL